MANNTEDIKWLYDKLRAKGYDIGSQQEFTSSLANQADRDWYYDKAVGMGLAVGSKDDFNALYAPVSAPTPKPQQEKPVQPQPTTQPQATATETATPNQKTQQPVSTPTPAPQPTWQPTEQEKIQMSYRLNSMMSDFNARSRSRVEQARRVAERNTPEGRRKLKAAKFQAQLAGTPTQVMGLAPDVSVSPSAENGQAVSGEQAKPLLSGQGPVPYGVVEEDGVRKTQWLLPDGSLTTDLTEADKAEYRARRVRLMNQFVGRMKENGLDPSKQEDVQRQAQLDYEAPIRKAVADAVQADDERSDKEQEAYMSNPLNMVGGVNAALGHAAVRKQAGIGDLSIIAEQAYESLPSSYRRDLIASYTDYFTQHPEEANGKTIEQAATDAAKSVVYRQVHEEYVKRNGPQSKNEFFLRKMLELNPASVALSSTINPRGQAYAELDAMERYGAEHRGLDIAGTVAGMALDPTTYFSAGVGNLAFKGATKAIGKRMLKEAAGEVAGRYAATTLTGRIIGGMAAGGANFGTFEAVKDAERQLYQGGYLNPETGEMEGFSFGSVLNSGVHGVGMGSATGVVSPLIGNVADKAVKATNSTAGKAAMRGTEVLASTLAEGTIFSIPEWISGDKDAFDVWTDNMAMMAGFKLSHAIKTAPAMIRSLRPVKPSGDRPLSRDERLHNNKDLSERLRERLDQSPSDIAMSREEREELKRKGYGDLSNLFVYDPEHKSRKVNAAQKAEGDYTGVTDLSRAVDYEPTLDETGNATFDGYEAMERLMEDESVSEATRAKAYYLLTGRMLPMSTITGWTREDNEDGTITITSHSNQGNIVTSRSFSGEKEAQREIDRIDRQSELNTIDVGEQYREAEAQGRVMEAAIQEVSPGADAQTVYNIYESVRRGYKDVTEEQRHLADIIDEAIERNSSAGDEVRPANIRARVSEETGVDIDKAIKKDPGKRTEVEKEAVKRYARELFPEQEAYEPTPEEAEADRVYDESRQLFGRFEQGDPEAQAEIDAISLRMEEANQLCEDAFGDEAEYWMWHVRENPWSLLNDPNLSADQKEAVLYYVNAKSALDGVLDASNEAASERREAVQNEVANRTHKERGMIVPATMKIDDKPVYIIKGDVAMFPDGSGVDVNESSDAIIILDESGEYKFISPDQILRVDDAIDPQIELQDAFSAIDQEQEAIISAVTDKEQGTPETVPNSSDTEESGMQPETEAPQNNSNVDEYDSGYQKGTEWAIKLPDDLLSDAIEDLRGRNTISEEDRGKLEAYEYEQQRRALEGNNDGENNPEENKTPSALDRIPVDEQTGDPMLTHESVDPETALDAAVEFFGSPEDALSYIQSEAKRAETAIAAAEKKVGKVKPTGGMMKYREDLAAARAEVENAKATLTKWKSIEDVQKRRDAEERARKAAEMAEVDAQRHEEAVEQFEEQQRIKAQKQAEQEALGIHAVNPKIKEKWDNAPKIDGHPDVVTLPDGTAITGHYIMTEAGSASASHDVNNAFAPTEGFPIDKNGQSVNDRDYERDKDAQQIVQAMADGYDSRALQTPVIVSKDGIVLSGNNRTMSGDIAALQGTDSAYLDYLNQYGRKYGFTPEQVSSMQHPRVVFVPEEDMPYDATTFSRFNAQEMKSQSKPEAAIKLGKIVDDDVFNRIVGEINRYNRLSDFYADQEASTGALGELMSAGVINDKQLPELRTGKALSVAGRELIENTLIGKIFQEEPEAVRMIIATPSVREGIMLGLSEIANNRTLAQKGYDLSNELSAAIDLVYRAKNSSPDIYGDGKPVSPFGRMQGLFDDEYGDSSVSDATTLLLADLLNSGKPSEVRKVLAMYNKSAVESSVGTVDLFSETGMPDTKEEILTRVNTHFRNATSKEQQALVDAAIEQRKRDAEQAAAEQSGRGETGDKAQPSDERGGEPESAADRPAAIDIAIHKRIFRKNNPDEASLREALEDYIASWERNHEPGDEERYKSSYSKYIAAKEMLEELHPVEPEKDLTPDDEALMARVEVTENDWEEGDSKNPTYKREIIIDGKHSVTQVDAPDKKGDYTGKVFEYDGNSFSDLHEVFAYIDSHPTLGQKIEEAEAEVNTEPTEAQKEAGNYRKGHVNVEGFDVTIEQPKGSLRSGTDARGKKWESTMNHTYGYIRGTKGVDGDHIDVFLSETPEEGNVYVVDQYNPDGSFDEHKVMYGFPDTDGARSAYLSNYEKGWENNRRIDVTGVTKDDFKKWIQSSKRKTKPFAEYSSVRPIEETSTIDEDRQPLSKEDYKEALASVTPEKKTRHERTKKVPINRVSLEDVMKDLSDKGETKLSDHAEPITTEPKQAQTITVDDEMRDMEDELRSLLGIDDSEGDRSDLFRNPEEFTNKERMQITSLGITYALKYFDQGIVSFPEFADKMVRRMGEKIRPWLKAFYGGARDIPGYDHLPFTTAEEVKAFDVMNFDKSNKDADPMRIAQGIVAENRATAATEAAKNEITEQRNQKRKERDEQTTADTAVITKQAEAIAKQAEATAESAVDEESISEASAKVDDALEKVNEQLAILGYYEAFGYMRNAERKAVADAVKLTKQLVKDLGIDIDKVSGSTTGKKSKNASAVKANIAPAGGDISIRLPLKEGRELYVSIGMDPSQERGDVTYRGDNLQATRIMYRVETPNAPGLSRYGINRWADPDISYDSLLEAIRNEAKDFLADAPGSTSKSETDKALEILRGGKSAPKREVKPEQTVGDLFGGLFDEPLKNEKETELQSRPGTGEREGGHEPRQDEPMGESQRNEDGGTDGRGMAGRGGDNIVPNTSGGDRVSGLPTEHAIRGERLPESERKNIRNNRAERGKDYAPKGVDARIRANIKAIELAQELLESGGTATPKQMAILRQFSGWGGLGKAFNDDGYSMQIKKLLGDAYQDAVDSRKSAYYTPAYIIDAMWDIARAMGFKGGNVLEGSAGIGNILGLMPEDMSDRSNIHAVEVDRTTGGMLSLLYPDAKVDIQGFEATKIPNGSVDLSITNVPFITGWNVADTSGDKDLSRKFRDIHDFCIAKNVRKLKPGGIGIFITSSGTLDNSDKLRAWLTNEGASDVVGAFRMNNQTFGGTGATSDIIVVRKRINGQKSPYAIDVSEVTGARVAEYDTGDVKRENGKEVPVKKTYPMSYNKYFFEHPENMAGEMIFNFEKGETFQPTSRALFPVKDKDQAAMLKDWAARFSEMDFEISPSDKPAYAPTYDSVGNEVKTGTMIADSQGRLCTNMNGVAIPVMGNTPTGYSKMTPEQRAKADAERVDKFNRSKIKGRTRQQCLKDYNELKKALADVLQYQTDHADNEGLEPHLKKLNQTFDRFVSLYGNLHKNTQLAWLRNDVDYPSILALESFDERPNAQGERIRTFGKTDIFSQRVVEKEIAPKPENVKDGIIASIYMNGRIDLPYISEALGRSPEDVKKEIISSGLGFENPNTTELEVSYEYLSGNVREKLRQAQDNNVDGKYNSNIKALERVIPMNIPAHLIEFTLGSSWITPKLYEDFIKERTGVSVRLKNTGGTWFVGTPDSGTNTELNRSQGVFSEMFKSTIFGHQLMEAAITNRSITVSRTYKHSDGTSETVTDKDATQACAAKIDEIRQDFKDWARQRMQQDPEMSAEMERVYNEKFNNYVAREIPEEFIPEHFGGAAHVVNGKPFKLRLHQAKAVIRGTMQSQLLAHEVGTGKTYTLISTAMEMRRLGTARKPMIVVQNATVGQFVESAKALYPNARILTIEEADRTAEGRKNFYAKIKYNDWDMIVVPQSVFERIPDSEERQIKFIQDKIEEKLKVLEDMKEEDPDGSSMVVRQAEAEIEKSREELNKITQALEEKRGKKKEKDEKREAQTRHNAEVRAMEMLDRETDDVENFDEMGIDAILVDEAHEYKHLGFSTAMQRGVKGIDPSYSKKAQGVYLKTVAVKERNNGRNVIFATGTPISNTAAEIWTFMRFLLDPDMMKEYGIYYFDDFVRNFGNLQQMLEFTTSGKFKENNRFAGYVNLPELVRIWSGAADTVLTREAGGVNDKIPKMEGDKAQDIYLPQTRALRSVMLFVKSELDRYENMTGKEKKKNSHIPLVMYGLAKAAAVDARLVVAGAEDDPNSKTNEAVRQTLKSLKETESYKGTVAIFADNYQNKKSGFNLYEDIRQKLIDKGVPADQIVVMRSDMTVKKKLDIFDRVNRGEVRVIMGSTFTLGTGVNIQERLHTLIHVDAPNRPMDYTQRNGRILRQGNLHKEMGLPVRVLRFGVEDSLDVTAYQRLKTKGAIADSIMNGKELISNAMENRSMEEDEDVFGDITAQLSGSEYAMLKNQAEKQVRKYTSKLKQWEAQQTHIHNQLPRLKGQIKAAEQRREEAQKHLEVIGTDRDGKITIGTTTYPNIDAMADLFTEHNKRVKTAQDEVREGSGERTMTMKVNVGGIDFTINTRVSRKIANNGQLSFESERNMTYSCEALGMEDVPVSGSRLKAAIEDIVGNVMNGDLFRERIKTANNSIERMKNEVSQLESQKGKPFEHVKELEEAESRLEEYTEKMKAELAEKEAKYADIDATVEAAEDIAFVDDEGEEETEEVKKDKGRELSRLVSEGNSLDFLNAQGHRSAYRYAQFVPGGLTKYGTGYVREGVRPPMTAIDSETQDWRAPMEFYEWEQSVEGMRKDNGKADLVQGNGRTTGNVAYNPYFHIRVHPLNDQFSAAYDRPELVVVEGDYPESELTSGYRAEGAKNAVGLTDWHAGSVNGQLSPGKKVQTVLSRYFKPRRIVPWSEVAERIMDHIAGEDVTFPLNVVTPRLRAELSKRGAKFHGISGSVSKDQRAHLEEVERELAAGNHDFGVEGGLSDSDIAKYNQRIDRLSSTDPNTMEGAVTLIGDKLNTPIRVISRQEAEAEGYRRKKGWYDRETGQITIVADNHRNVGDIADTAVHEAVGHHGLRQLFGTEEKLNNFLDEAYNISNDKIKAEIDRRTERMMDDEVERLRETMRKEHEARGENPDAEYYADMAKARIEAEKQREKIRRDATEEYAADLGMKIGEEGFERMDAEELTFWGKIKGLLQKALDRLLAGLKLPKMRRWTDKEWSYVLWRSWRNLREGNRQSFFTEAEDIVRREKSNYGASESRLFRDGDMGLEEAITKMKSDAAAANGADFKAKQDAMRAIGGNLSKLRQAMARQREYDITTVKSMTDLSKILLDGGLLDDLSKYETKRILSAIKDAVGREDTSKQVQRLMDIMVDNQLRMGANYFGKLLSVKGSRVDARGIEVQGELDPDGQKIAQTVRRATTRTLDDIENLMAEAINRMSSTDQAAAEEAALEYAGLQIAHQYVEEIRESKNEEKELRKSIDEYKAERNAEAEDSKKSIEQARVHKDAGRMTEHDFNLLEHDIEEEERARWAAFKQYAEATNDAIRQNKIERAESYRSLSERLGGVLGESVERAKAWREAEKQRVEDIHHNANSDMEGRPTNEHHKADRLQKLVNNGIFRFVLAPLGTFDQMLRMFGRKSVRGEGYLWNRYMRGWVDCTEKEYTGYQEALKTLDKKVMEVFEASPYDKPASRARSWGDLFALERRMPKASVRFWDGGEKRDHELTQGNLLYIYMTDKMTDGRMKLRRMGITEADVDRIKNFVDPRMIQLADWMQEEFLTEKRNDYNEVHKRMFGTSMASIENYFPLKILANARMEDVDVADDASRHFGDSILPATSTGSIIKRKRNNLALDVTGADAFSVILDHIQQMERWAAFAEYNRDLNTLLSYKRFRNQVMNMTSAYGAGKTLWTNFRNVAAMAAGAYRPPIAPLDKAAVNIAKGVTAAKVSFRVFTALKQFLSMPAYLSDSNPLYLAANIANPVKAWNWSMDNLPLFEKRWKSRMAGDPRLLKSDMDWKMWRSRIVEIAGRIGMSPNAFVDALTVAIGARSMYQTKLAKYKRQGYTPEQARKRARQDATILFNQTQQSSEGAFLSTMQVDRSWLSVLFTVFRNSSMSYTRQLYDALRNIGRRLTPGYKGLSEEFMAKQMRRDGIDPDKADQNAKQEYRRGLIRDMARVAVFGAVLQMAWNLGAYLPYLIFGKNTDEKDRMLGDVWNHTMFGSIEGLTGGDVMSAAGQMWLNGEGNPEQLTKDMPLASDVVSILKKMDKDYVSAMNDVVNLFVQSGLGFNPQSLTDAVVAVMDYCGEDAETSRECALLISRIINCPQSQIDKIYFDEIDATGEEASTMTPEEIAERYAEYKLQRNAPLTGWAYDEEGRKAAMEKQRKKARTTMKERMSSSVSNDRTRELLESFDEVSNQEKELNRLKKKDREAYRSGKKDLRSKTDMRKHNRVKRYNHEIKLLTEKWQNAKTAEEADSIARAMVNARDRMLEDIEQLSTIAAVQ